MKKYGLLLLWHLPIALFAQSPTLRETTMLKELNLVRSNPAAYAVYVEAYLAKQLKGAEEQRGYTVNRHTVIRNGKKTVTTDTTYTGGGYDPTHINQAEVSAARELLAELRTTKPMQSLALLPCLYECAREQGLYCRSLQKMTHDNPKGKLSTRILNRCTTLRGCAENWCAGAPSIRQSMIVLLVDGSIPSRSHRRNILNATYRYAAVYDIGAVGVYRSNCWVQEFGL